MRLRGMLADLGKVEDGVGWRGQTIRSVWRRRQRRGFSWDQWHERWHHAEARGAAPGNTRCCG